MSPVHVFRNPVFQALCRLHQEMPRDFVGRVPRKNLKRLDLCIDKGARQRFLEYLATLNAMHARPRWYNVLTTKCTTSIRTQHAVTQRQPWDWRILLNGLGDEMLYEHGALAGGGLPFAQLKERAHINEAARAANDAPDFSERIRAGRPGFAP